MLYLGMKGVKYTGREEGEGGRDASSHCRFLFNLPVFLSRNNRREVVLAESNQRQHEVEETRDACREAAGGCGVRAGRFKCHQKNKIKAKGALRPFRWLWGPAYRVLALWDIHRMPTDIPRVD